MSSPALYVTGASGYLGHEVVKVLKRMTRPFRSIDRAAGFDLGRPFMVEDEFASLLEAEESRVILLHMAAMSRWADCEKRQEIAFAVNSESTGVLASVLGRYDGRFVYVSTDLVFDGEHAPYREEDEPRPGSIYGKSKYLGECLARACKNSLVLRLPLLFGPSADGTRGASDAVLQAVREGVELSLYEDEWRTPLHVAEAAERVVECALDMDRTGVAHLSGPDRLSRLELGLRVAKEAGFDVKSIKKASRLDYPFGTRPMDCSLVPSE